MDNPTHVYIGTTPCGCTVLAMVDADSHKRDTAKEIGKAIRDGLTIQRVTLEDFRSVKLARCNHKVAKAAQP